MRTSSVLTLAASLLVVSNGFAKDWPQFRGPTGQGLAELKNPPVKWSLQEGLAWTRVLPGSGWSSPVVQGDRIVLSIARGEGDTVTLGAVAIDAETGKTLWTRDLFHPTAEEARARHGDNGLASGTPFIAGDTVYVHFAHMGTAALKLSDGGVRWTQKIAYKPVHGTGSSPILVGDVLVFNADAASDPTLVALDAQTGKVRWRTPRNQEVRRTFSFCTPIVIQNDGQTQILSPGSGMIGAYDPADGKLIWKVRYGEGYSVVPRPVYANGLVYVATGFDRARLLAINPKGAKEDVTDTHVVWEETKWIPKTPSFVASGGVLYIIDDTGTLSCRDGKTGELKWREKLAGNFWASPILAGDRLYCCSKDGVCFVIDVSPKAPKVLAEIDMGETIFASPAVVDGALIIRGERHLWRIDN